MLVLTVPQLNLSTKDIKSILRHFYEEVKILVKAFLVSFLICFKDLLLATPQLFLVYTILQRLPATISLTLHDNITLEDALGRVQALQFQQFRHWQVFEASLRCQFDQLPGMRQVLSGSYVLMLPKRGIEISAQNWAATIRSGVLIEMAIVLTHLQAPDQKCPRQCLSGVSRLRGKEYCCNQCGLKFQCYTGPVTKRPSDATTAPDRPSQHHSPRASTSATRTSRVESLPSPNREPLTRITAVQAKTHRRAKRKWPQKTNKSQARTDIEADIRDLASLKRVRLHEGDNRVAKRFVTRPLSDDYGF
jgi:hypothetical protein